jgi:predicted AAA+ superfamily ATPase
VLIVEGPRTCGKTYVARHLVDQGVWERFESLADPDTAAVAANDMPGWLMSLPDHTVIDEAQLLPDLSLRLKALVDQQPKRRFLLTGSAHLARTGLGGVDPLTGRVRRWRLNPLTAFELSGHPSAMGTLIGRLFEGDILADTTSDTPTVGPSDSTKWRTTLQRGGFPLLALGTVPTRQAAQWVRDTVSSLLSDNLLPGERFDSGLARRVLDACLRVPGDILNIAALGQRLGLDPRTVDRYLDVMDERFLLLFLPNLATNPTRQTRARSKVHPVDSAFAYESIQRADPDALRNPAVIGHLFESWVAAQILPCLQLHDGIVEAFYWRDAKTDREVDIVVADSEGRHIGVEVKASTQVGVNDTVGLQAMARRLPLTMGYVVYTGDRVARLADRIWALPVPRLMTS